MPSQISSVVLIGYNNRDNWGSLQRRPARAVYIVHGSAAPFICDEGYTFHREHGPEHSMVLRLGVEEFTHDVAYFVLTHSGHFDAEIAKAGHLPGCEGWLDDPRDAKEDVRAKFHGAIADRMGEAGLRLQVVRFGPGEFSDAYVERLAVMGCAVDVFDMTRDDRSQPEESTS